jgi:hypothetical protein
VIDVLSGVGRCANCGHDLHGDFCSRCGQRAGDLHQPFGHFLRQAVEDLFNLDTRLTRTLRPLLLEPGAMTRVYLAGRRAPYVPPLRAYLIAALIFFGLFTIFPPRDPDIVVVTQGSPEAAALRAQPARGGRSTFELPASVPIYNERYQAAAARAKANPRAFGAAVFRNIPRAFFILLPLFALLLKLFYRQGYYVEHLVFALYYHAFAFTAFAALFLLGRSAGWMPGAVRIPAAWLLVIWVHAYLPLALRRVYGGSWAKTLLKVAAMGFLYLAAFIMSVVGAMAIALARF